MKKLWSVLRSPSVRHSLGALLVLGILIGVIGVAGFDASMEATSSDEFCNSCHEIGDNAGREFEGTHHHTNPSGVVASCVSCHLPKPFVPKMRRKLYGIYEIYHHLLGTIGTPEKFEEHRMRMAMGVWEEFNRTDSRECRACHTSEAFDLAAQSEKAREFHENALRNGQTCIDCHKGLAHKLPEGIEEDFEIKGIDF